MLAIDGQHVVAVESGDAEQIHEILHDDVSHNLDAVAQNQPGNEDEVAIYEMLGDIDFTTLELLVSEETQSAVVLYEYSFMGGQMTGTALALFELECGDIKEIYQESTSLGMLMGAAGMNPMATPEA